MDQQLLDRFRAELDVQGRSENTIKSYVFDVRKYLNWLGSRQPDRQSVLDYRLYLRENAMTHRSIARNLFSLRKFFKSVLNTHLEVESPSFKDNLPPYFTNDEVMHILKSVGSLRELTLFSLIYECGLRRNEARNLDVGDIDILNKKVHVRYGKTGWRLVPFRSDKVAAYIQKYVGTRTEGPLFIQDNGSNQRISNSHINFLFSRAFERSNVQKPVGNGRIGVHSLRHSAATYLLNTGMNIREVQEVLGHKRIETTARYTHITQGELSKRVSENKDRMEGL